MKRSRAPSSRVVSVPKSTHYVNWIRLFFALPSTLTSSPGNNSAVLQQALQPHKTSEGQVLLTTSAEKFVQLHEKNQSVLFCTLYICVILCVCVCVCVCSSRGRSSENDSVSVAGRNSNPLISFSESPASQLSLCLWHPTRPLAPPPAPFEGGYPGNWKLFSKKDKRGETSADTARRRSVWREGDGEVLG